MFTLWWYGSSISDVWHAEEFGLKCYTSFILTLTVNSAGWMPDSFTYRLDLNLDWCIFKFYFFLKQNCQGVPQIKSPEIGCLLPFGHESYGWGRTEVFPDALMHEILFFVSLNVKICLYLTFSCTQSDNSSVHNLSLYIRARIVQDKGRKS